MDALDALLVLIGALVTFALILAWKVVGQHLDTLRTTPDRLDALAKTVGECYVRADFAQNSVLRTMKGLDKLGGVERVTDLLDRITALEKRVASIDLEVLDTAEKVANRLSDRERKRRDRDEPEEIEEDEATLMARARAAFPLPSLFEPS